MPELTHLFNKGFLSAYHVVGSRVPLMDRTVHVLPTFWKPKEGKVFSVVIRARKTWELGKRESDWGAREWLLWEDGLFFERMSVSARLAFKLRLNAEEDRSREKIRCETGWDLGTLCYSACTWTHLFSSKKLQRNYMGLKLTGSCSKF